MKKSKLYSLMLSAASIIGLALYACSSDSTITFDPASGSTISVTDKITITGASKDSFALSGNMAALADQSWDGDTLTLTPKEAWNSAFAGTLVVTPNGGGEASSATYGIQLTFTTFQKASVVIGQDTFVTGDSGMGSGGLDSPYGVHAITDTGAMVFTDTDNNRALIFNKIPTENGRSANNVIGQVNLASNLSGTTDKRMDRPEGALFFEGKLLIKDYDNNRILVYNEVPTSNNAAADVVIGQLDFTSADSTCNDKTLNGPEGFFITSDGKLYVADSDHNRILVWNKIPTTNGKAADIVIGQSDFTHCYPNDANQDEVTDSGASSKVLDYPSAIWTDGKKMIVTDSDNNRVLIYNKVPTSSGLVKPNVVLGQENFANNAPNDDDQEGSDDGHPSSRTMSFPYYMHCNGTQLFIDDDSNSRILIWNEIPTETFAKADVVLGQGAFTKNQPNDDDQDGIDDGHPSSRTFDGPEGITLYGDKLIVSDNGNNRVLIFQGK